MGTARRLVAGGMLLAVVLTGCGSNDKQADTGVGDSEVATGGRLFSTADEATAKLGSDAAAGAFPRTVKHALGETKLEKKPERVVVLDSGELDGVLALGITPVGMATNAGQSGVPSYLADKAQGIKTVGGVTRTEPRGDRRAQAGPDPRQQAARQRPVPEAQRDRADRVQHPARVPVEGRLPAGRPTRSARRPRPPSC